MAASRVIRLGLGGAVGAVYAAVVWSRSPLAWDGAYYFFQPLDLQRPITVFGRTAIIPLELPALFASRFTDNLAILSALFSAAYGAIPFLLAAGIWAMARRTAPALFGWTVLLWLALLPGQLFFVSEAIIACQLVWLATVSVLAPPSPASVALGILAAAFAFNAHPDSGPLLITAGVIGLVASAIYTQRRWQTVPLSVLLITLGLLAVARLVVAPDSAERGMIGPANFVLALTMVGPLPSLSVALTAIAAGAFAATTPARRWPMALAVGCVLVAGALLAWWGMNPVAWAQAGRWRFVAPVITLGVLAAAGASTLRHASPLTDPAWPRWATPLLAVLGGIAAFWMADTSHWLNVYRLAVTASLVAAVPLGAWFNLRAVQPSLPANEGQTWPLWAGGVLVWCLTLGVQSAAFGSLQDRLRATIATAPSGCIDLPADTPMLETYVGNWTLTVRSLLAQQRMADRYIAWNGQTCAAILASGFLQIAPEARRSINAPGWFVIR